MLCQLYLRSSFLHWRAVLRLLDRRACSGIGYKGSQGDQENQGHWLDRYFPSARPWLQTQNRNWWIYGIKSRCNEFPALKERKDSIHYYLEKAYHSYYQKHQSLVTDGPSHTHLQMACLVLATYKVLRPWIKDDKVLSELIASQMGASGAPLLRGLLHSTLFLRSRLFSSCPFLVLSRMMKSLQFDMGAAWKSNLTQNEKETRLEITKCLYQDVFSSEGLSLLTSSCCCSQDKTWFEGMEYHRVGYLREQWLGKGDLQCCLVLKKHL